MKINAVKTVQVEAKILRIHMKVRDTFEAELEDVNGAKLKDYEGSKPSQK